MSWERTINYYIERGYFPFFKPYAFGYVDPNITENCISQFTVMGGGYFSGNGCHGVRGLRVPYFSNPDLFFPPPDRGYADYPFQPNTPMGIPGDEFTTRLDGPVNASRAIDEVWDIVAALSEPHAERLVGACARGDVAADALSSGLPATLAVAPSGATRQLALSTRVPSECANNPRLSVGALGSVGGLGRPYRARLSTMPSDGAFGVTTAALGEGRQQLSISAGPHYGSCSVSRRGLATVELADNVVGGVARKVAGVSRVHIALRQGAAHSYCTGAPGAKLRQLGDFDGDGGADALLRHADGRWLYYPLGAVGSQSTSGAANLPSDSAISVSGVGDFNGDGRDDVLMRLASGAWRYYPMDGSRTGVGSGEVALPTDLAWELEGVGDFNGDGKDDVLLRRRGARAARWDENSPLQMVDEWRYYPMDGRTVLEGGTPAGLHHNFGDWVAGVGDFNGDGRDDVLFRLSDGGWHYLPFHGGSGGTTSVLAGAGAVALPEDMAWATAGIADFNGDGRDDVLLRHEDGRWRYRLMNGRHLLGGGGVPDLPADREVWLAGVGDMNGDGLADVLTRHGHDAWQIYVMDAATGAFRSGGDAELANDPAWGVLKGGAEDPPRVRASLTDRLFAIDGDGATLDLSLHFSDDQTLVFNAESSSADVLRASVAGERLTLAPVAAGRATVTVTGQDADGYIAWQAFEVIVGAVLPDRPLAIGWDAPVDLSLYFSDDRTLTFEAESSDANVVAVSVTGRLLALAPAAVGRATVTVRATNADGNVVAQRFQIVVSEDGEGAERPPQATTPLPGQSLVIGSEAVVDLSSHFSEDQTLVFEVASSDGGVVRVSVAEKVLTLAPVANGQATITVTGRNADGYVVSQTFQATVRALLPDSTLAVGWDATLDLSVYFSDEEFAFAVQSSDAGVVGVSVTGGLLTLAPLAVGRATITLTARDADGNAVAHRFEVAVGVDGEAGRLPPRAIAPVPGQPIAIGSDATLDLSGYFSGGQALTFEATSNDSEVVRVSVAGSVLTLAPVADGWATVTVTARDANGYLARQTFQAIVSEDGQVGRRFRDCPECPEMVVVPAGSFMMGSPAEEEGGPRSDQRHERPQHRVDFAAPFAIGVFEVTYEQWDACVADGGCNGDGVQRFPPFDEPNYPVLDVSWNDAQAYVEWLSAKTGQAYRLPSDAEWEYAARAGTTTPFHFGEAITTDQANYDGEVPSPRQLAGEQGSSYARANPGIYRGAPVPVGSLPANLWGLHEVHGNLAEWTRDCFDGVGYAGWPADGSAVESGDCDRRYLRNGSYYDDAGDVRSARRQVRGVLQRSVLQGFRVAKTLGD